MARTAAIFKQADVTRALRATISAGVEVARVEVDPSGKIIVVAAGKPVEDAVPALDAWRAKRGSR